MHNKSGDMAAGGAPEYFSGISEALWKEEEAAQGNVAK